MTVTQGRHIYGFDSVQGCSEIFVEMIQDILQNIGNDQIIDKDSERPIVRHQHVNQITVLEEGSGWALIGDQVFEIQTGDIMIISKNRNHSFFTMSRLHLKHYYWPKKLFEQSDRIIVEAEFNIHM